MQSSSAQSMRPSASSSTPLMQSSGAQSGIGVCSQIPVSGLQTSRVQESPSSQLMGVPIQLPAPSQLSSMVQGSPSSQGEPAPPEQGSGKQAGSPAQSGSSQSISPSLSSSMPLTQSSTGWRQMWLIHTLFGWPTLFATKASRSRSPSRSPRATPWLYELPSAWLLSAKLPVTPP